MWQTVLTIFYIVWLIAVLAFLWLIWWDTRRYIRLMETTMLQSRSVSAQAALKAAEVANRLADIVEAHRAT